jgi:SH3-like domain-containing protein
MLFALLLCGLSGAPLAAAQENPSGLPLPRFVTTRSTPINVRVGPGTRYDVAWIYLKPGTPVEIVQEFDTWRKIRVVDGTEGWIHQNLLSGKRAGIVAPWSKDDRIPLFLGKSQEGGVRAILSPGFEVEISDCDGSWCEVAATDHPPQGRQTTYTGYLPQAEIWGVYKDEKFN